MAMTVTEQLDTLRPYFKPIGPGDPSPDPEQLDPSQFERGELRLVAQRLYDGDDPASVQQDLSDGLVKALVSPDPDTPTEIPTRRDPSLVYAMPPLPDAAQPDLGLAAGTGYFINAYVELASKQSPMTPRLFHESAALSLGSIAIARRLCLDVGHGPIYPNLFILWLAVTTLFRKSTALRSFRAIAQEALPHLLAAQDATPEALLSNLSGREPSNLADLSTREQDIWRQGRDFAAQRGWMLDEASGLLASFGRDYNAGLKEMVLKLFDCDPYYRRSTKGDGLIVVRDAYLSLLGASTPAAMATHLRDQRPWEDGFWPRFAILTPETERPEWATATPGNHADDTTTLIGSLRSLCNRLPQTSYPNPPDALNLALGPGVYDAWQAFNKALSHDLLCPPLDMRLYGTYGRLPEIALKIAMILAAFDWPETAKAPTVYMPQLVRAISIAESWRASVHRALYLAENTSINGLKDRLYQKIAECEPLGITKRDLGRAFQTISTPDIERGLSEMLAMGEIAEERSKTGGRDRSAYKLAF